MDLRAERIGHDCRRIVRQILALSLRAEHADAIEDHSTESLRLRDRHFGHDVSAGMTAVEIRLLDAERIHDSQTRVGVVRNVRGVRRSGHGITIAERIGGDDRACATELSHQADETQTRRGRSVNHPQRATLLALNATKMHLTLGDGHEAPEYLRHRYPSCIIDP